MVQNLLEMRNITKSFNGVTVLHDAQLEVRPGEVQVLLGENGAGKSTMIKILSGAYRREKGEIFLEGKPFEIKTPKEAIDRGISVIYQEFNLVPYIPIYENIFLGKEYGAHGGINHQKAIEEAKVYMDRIGLELDPRTLVSSLSVAQKQMVEIAKAISNDVKVLVLDEPTAAITDKETERLFSIVRDLKKQGIGIIYISHRMNELFEIGDRCTVMRDGAFIKMLDLDKTNVDELITLMVGREVKFDKIENPYVDPTYNMLQVQGLSYKNLLKNVSFDVKKGEIFGFAGLVGSGRTEVAKCVIGAYQRSGGDVYMENGTKKLAEHNIASTIQDGVVYLSEDRKDEGLVLPLSVADNVALPNLHQFGKGFLNNRAITKTAREFIGKLKVKTTSHLQPARELSGGNQQKVVIAKWLCNDAKVYIFDEPTRGIDVGARDEIYNIMMDIVKKGNSIVMISSDLVEVMKMCDRIAVMHEGELTAVLENKDGLTQEDVLSYALHGGAK